MRKLSNKEIEEKGLLVDSTCYSALCRKTKEIKEITIRSFEDVKKAAELLSSKNWVAIYAACNEDHVIIVFSRL